MVFELLNPKLQKLVKERFTEPTLPQKLAIPKILNGRDILLISKTGTGKTESCMLPIFNFLIERDLKPIAALYITPLRALNRDLLDRLIWWSNKLGIDIAVRHGDTSTYERRLQAEFPPLLLISTLETLQPILTGRKLRKHLENVKYVILDEVHEIADSKRGIQLALALERLKQLCKDFQLIMLSATIGDPEKIVKFFAHDKKVEIIKAITPKQMRIKVIFPSIKPKDKIIAEKVFCSLETAARIRKIVELVKNSRSSLIFTNTREFAEILSSRIKSLEEKLKAGVHHSSLSKNVRIRVEKEFKAEKLKAIICTSSLQLGIDIGSVDLVIQYMSPRQIAQLIQRVGRSGHGIRRISRGIILPINEDDIFEAAVIARKALNEELEKVKFHEKSYDVLAHQIVGLCLEYGRIDLEKAFKIFKNSFAYRNMTFNEFVRICKFLERIGLIFVNGYVKKKRRGIEYYFENLSTIPSVRQYRIVNAIDKSVVGLLDEEFVVLHASEGTTFIVKGEPWRILSIEEDKVIVEPSQDIEAAIPSWEGELIPVPFEVAQEVGKLRREIAENLDDEKMLNEILRKYPIDEKCKEKMVKIIEKQGIVPDDKTILIENEGNIYVIHACCGSKTNEALARFLSAFIANRLGTVKMSKDPYRIILELPVKNEKIIEEAFKNVKPEHVKIYVEKDIENSELFKWKFLHVAKRFGVLRKEVRTPYPTSVKKIISEFHKTPLYEETLREIETEKVDVEKAVEIIKKVQAGEISLIFKEGFSPLARLGLKRGFGEVVISERIEILKVFKERLLKTKVNLICLNCANWMQSFVLKDLPEGVKCKKCEAKLLAISTKISNKDIKIAKKKLRNVPLTKEESRRFRYLQNTAELFLVYGKKAAIALAGRGVGPETAKRILAKKYLDETRFYKEILKAERTYLRTKKFWKV
jgi:ATP-dependent Lhr-like helicase